MARARVLYVCGGGPRNSEKDTFLYVRESQHASTLRAEAARVLRVRTQEMGGNRIQGDWPPFVSVAQERDPPMYRNIILSRVDGVVDETVRT